jgi:hypothetical protein
MRIARWMPLTFLAGLHGFVFFAPYAAFVLGIVIVRRYSHRSDRKILS